MVLEARGPDSDPWAEYPVLPEESGPSEVPPAPKAVPKMSGHGRCTPNESCLVPVGCEGARTLQPDRGWALYLLREIIKLKPEIRAGPDCPKVMSWWSPRGVELIIHRHKKLRQKLFDTDHEELPESKNGCLHLMWMESGLVCLRLERRQGRFMPYMQEKWVGYTVFYQ